MNCGVYKITCNGNNKIYIGSSFNVDKRIETHFRQLKSGKHINRHLKSSYDLYGFESFSWELLEICSEEQLIIREQFWMDQTKCYDRVIGFNNTLKADRPTGYKHTPEAREKMSKAKIGKKPHPNALEGLRKKNTGSKRTEEQKKNMSLSKMGDKNPMFGKKYTEEQITEKVKGLLSVPRWNKGLTIKDDPRLAKLATRIGKTPPNAIECKLIDLENRNIWEAESLKHLSKKCPISLPTIWRLKNGKAGKKITKKYKLEINESRTT